MSAALDSLTAEVAALRAELAALRAELAREVRTERLVVVHPDDGREQLYTERFAGSIMLRCQWEAGSEAPTATIGAGDETPGGDAWVSVGAAGASLATISASADADTEHQQHHGSLMLDRAESDGPRPPWLEATPAGVSLRDPVVRGIVRFEVPTGGTR